MSYNSDLSTPSIYAMSIFHLFWLIWICFRLYCHHNIPTVSNLSIYILQWSLVSWWYFSKDPAPENLQMNHFHQRLQAVKCQNPWELRKKQRKIYFYSQCSQLRRKNGNVLIREQVYLLEAGTFHQYDPKSFCSMRRRGAQWNSWENCSNVINSLFHLI